MLHFPITQQAIRGLSCAPPCPVSSPSCICNVQRTTLADRSRLPFMFVQKYSCLITNGPLDPKFQVEWVAPRQALFFSENHSKSSFVWYENLDRPFFRFVTIHASERQTDRPPWLTQPSHPYVGMRNKFRRWNYDHC